MQMRSNRPGPGLATEVSVGSEALQVTQALRPDVIVVASTLSDMTGLEVVRALRDRYRRCNFCDIEGDFQHEPKDTA